MSAYIRECPGIDPYFRQRGQRLSVGYTAGRDAIEASDITAAADESVADDEGEAARGTG